MKRYKKGKNTPSPSMGEGWDEGDKTIKKATHTHPSPSSPPARGGEIRLFTRSSYLYQPKNSITRQISTLPPCPIIEYAALREPSGVEYARCLETFA
jgi:hypothetical protein